jgi:hypothetical protein
MERNFTLEVDVEYTLIVRARSIEMFSAESLADAKRQAEEKSRELETGEDWRAIVDGGYEIQGATCEEVETELVTLRSEEGDEYESLGIDEGDDKPFADEDEGETN